MTDWYRYTRREIVDAKIGYHAINWHELTGFVSLDDRRWVICRVIKVRGSELAIVDINGREYWLNETWSNFIMTNQVRITW